MVTKQNKGTHLNVLHLMFPLWLAKRKTLEELLWQLILFSERLLQLKEQKYGRGASLQARGVLDPG